MGDHENAAAASTEATLGALTEALSGLRVSSKKPELPAFDKANIDLWIKRVESAFTRANVVLAKNKFAHLEAKIGVDEDPRINEFLFNPLPSDAMWTSFTSYLRRRHGRSKQQRAAVVLDGVRRDGRSPSELFAVLKERVGDISVDDLLKEMVVRELPTEVQRSIWEKSQALDGIATAELADSYFDKDGRPIHKASSSINVVDHDPAQPLDSLVDETSDVNFVGARPKRFNNNNDSRPRRSQQPSSNSAFRSKTPSRRGSGVDTNSSSKPGDLCRYHAKFGKEAIRCLPGCPHFKDVPKGQAPRQA